jgi:hypothetical protein
MQRMAVDSGTQSCSSLDDRGTFPLSKKSRHGAISGLPAVAVFFTTTVSTFGHSDRGPALQTPDDMHYVREREWE